MKLKPHNTKTTTFRNRHTALDAIEHELRVYRIQYDFPPQKIHFSSTFSLPPKEILDTIREEINGKQGALFKLSILSVNQMLEPYCDDEHKSVVWPDKNWTDSHPTHLQL